MTLKRQDNGANDNVSRHSFWANDLSKNWVSQGFLADQCEWCISTENGAFDVRWVRFPKHIPFISFWILLAFQFAPLKIQAGASRYRRCRKYCLHGRRSQQRVAQSAGQPSCRPPG